MTEIYNLDGRKVEGAFYYPNGEEIEGEDGAQKDWRACFPKVTHKQDFVKMGPLSKMRNFYS